MFKIGLSSYSLSRAINAGEMDILGAIRWISENGGEHMELSPGSLVLAGNNTLIKAIVKQAEDCGIELSSYTTSRISTAGRRTVISAKAGFRLNQDISCAVP